MIYKETVSETLLQVSMSLMAIEELKEFRMVGGTAIALQLGHRKSIDIDLFSNEKVDLRKAAQALKDSFPEIPHVTLTENNLSVVIRGIKLDIYHDWSIPFKKPLVIENDIRIAALEDLAAFKLSAIVGRREKKDYIDLFFLFKSLNSDKVLSDFKTYEPLLSDKSLLFALTEVDSAQENKSAMPDMLIDFDWNELKNNLKEVAKQYVKKIGDVKGMGLSI
jgi:Nucleotidyl transferase AbiEii toxin, Type IV TA system